MTKAVQRIVELLEENIKLRQRVMDLLQLNHELSAKLANCHVDLVHRALPSSPRRRVRQMAGRVAAKGPR